MKHIDFLNSPRIDQVGIEDRIARITARSIKKESKMQGLLMALNMIDLTTLEGADTDEKVKQLCFKAHHLHDELPQCFRQLKPEQFSKQPLVMESSME